jgi:small subunit ribosomal protein S16
MIRLARFGARKQPYYRVVVIEKDRARNGRSIEVVGTYNPRTSPATVDLKRERIAYWCGQGAQLSPTVEKLLTRNPASAATEAQVAASVPEPVAASVPEPVAASVPEPVVASVPKPVAASVPAPEPPTVPVPEPATVEAPVKA